MNIEVALQIEFGDSRTAFDFRSARTFVSFWMIAQNFVKSNSIEVQMNMEKVQDTSKMMWMNQNELVASTGLRLEVDYKHRHSIGTSSSKNMCVVPFCVHVMFWWVLFIQGFSCLRFIFCVLLANQVSWRRCHQPFFGQQLNQSFQSIGNCFAQVKHMKCTRACGIALFLHAFSLYLQQCFIELICLKRRVWEKCFATARVA